MTFEMLNITFSEVVFKKIRLMSTFCQLKQVAIQFATLDCNYCDQIVLRYSKNLSTEILNNFKIYIFCHTPSKQPFLVNFFEKFPKRKSTCAFIRNTRVLFLPPRRIYKGSTSAGRLRPAIFMIAVQFVNSENKFLCQFWLSKSYVRLDFVNTMQKLTKNLFIKFILSLIRPQFEVGILFSPHSALYSVDILSTQNRIRYVVGKNPSAFNRILNQSISIFVRHSYLGKFSGRREIPKVPFINGDVFLCIVLVRLYPSNNQNHLC